MLIHKIVPLMFLSLSVFGQNTPKFKLSKAQVLIFLVSKLDRSIPFYQDRLGLMMTSRVEDFAFFDAGGITIALREQPAASKVKDSDPVELAFSVEHVKQAYRSLKELGVEFRVEPRVITGTTWATDFRDPDGHVLSIVGPE